LYLNQAEILIVNQQTLSRKSNTAHGTSVGGTPLYDIIVESCENMLWQYDKLTKMYKVNGAMIIFTDGRENSSKQ